MTQRTFTKRVIYDILRIAARQAVTLVFKLRVDGRHHYPQNGGGLVLSNHQSHLDPILVGLTCDRRLNYVARKTLFKFGPFRWLIDFLDAIPLDREGLGLAGIKETLRRLKNDELVVLFPEGTRTPDGKVHRLKPGFRALAVRTGVPIIPVGMVGAFDAWPRSQHYPRLSVIRLEMGEPLSPEQIEKLDETQLLEEVGRRIQDCHLRAAMRRKRLTGLPRVKHRRPTYRKRAC